MSLNFISDIIISGTINLERALMKKYYQLKVPKIMDGSPESIIKLYKPFDQYLDVANSGDEILFDFSSCTWLNAEIVVFLASMFQFASLRGIRITFKLEDLRPKIKDILLKNRFLAHFGVEETKVDTYGTTIPFFRSKITNTLEIDQYIDEKLLVTIRDKTNPVFLNQVKESLFEIIHNVGDHSESDQMFMCGQHYPNKPQNTQYGTMIFGISDCGIGLLEKINRSGRNFDDLIDMFDWAFEKGTSTKETVDGGVGLFELKRKLSHKAEITVIANFGYYKIRKDTNVEFCQLPFNVIGTTVLINFSLDDCQSDGFDDTIDISDIQDFFEEMFI